MQSCMVHDVGKLGRVASNALQTPGPALSVEGCAVGHGGQGGVVLYARVGCVLLYGVDGSLSGARGRIHLARTDDVTVRRAQHEVRLPALRTPPPKLRRVDRAYPHGGDALERARLARVALAAQDDLGFAGDFQTEAELIA